MTFRSSSVALALLCTILAIAAPARAQAVDPDTRAAAEALFNQGRALMEAGRFAEACEKFEASNRFDPSVGTLLNLGVCREQNSQIPLAWETFRLAAEQARKAGDQRERYALDRMNALARQLYFVWIEVPAQTRAPEMNVLFDGKPLPAGSWGRPIVVEPGPHRVQATAPGVMPFETRVEVSTPGEEVRVEIPVLKPVAPEPAPAPVEDSLPPEPTPMHDRAPGPGMPLGRKLALGSGAVGVAGLVLGSIAGLQASSRYDQAEELCPRGSAAEFCLPDERDWSQRLRDEARARANLATASFAVGIAAVAAGAALWYLSPPASPEAASTTRIEPLVSPTLAGFGVRTTF